MEDELRDEIRGRIEEAAEESDKSQEEIEDLVRKDDWLDGWCARVPFQGDMGAICDLLGEVFELVEEEELTFEEAMDEVFSEEPPEESSDEGEDLRAEQESATATQ